MMNPPGKPIIYFSFAKQNQKVKTTLVFDPHGIKGGFPIRNTDPSLRVTKIDRPFGPKGRPLNFCAMAFWPPLTLKGQAFTGEKIKTTVSFKKKKKKNDRYPVFESSSTRALIFQRPGLDLGA